ncbi:MAG: hypothetical protein Q4B87_00405 [Candidatus Saccharibacteria bacterium]|nr:hypothetical protein [Candidatus Saccharibacteria bacterium]
MPERKRKYRWVKWLVLGLVVVGVVVAVLINNNFNSAPRDDSEKNAKSAKTEEVSGNSSEEKKEDEKRPDTKEEVVESEPKAPQYDGDNPNKSETLTGVISYAGVNGGNLMIRVNIDQFLSDGVCNLSLLKDGRAVYTVSAAIEGSVSTSNCNGFNISASELEGGNYAIEVSLESAGKYGKIVGEVQI